MSEHAKTARRILASLLYALAAGCADDPPAYPGATAGPTTNGGGATSSGDVGGGSTSSGDVGGGSPSSGDAGGASTTGGPSAPAQDGSAPAVDAANPPAAGCTPFEMPADCVIPDDAVLPRDLRCTGLYGDWQARSLRCDAMPYAPAYALWSDAAAKVRYAHIPAGTSVDASQPDDFTYPVGTKFWKEFWVGPPGSQKLGETRYLIKGELGWLYTTYVWNDAGTEAVQQNDGVVDLMGTGHEVPSRMQCKECHSGRADYVLGWDPFMLGAGAEGATLASLTAPGPSGTPILSGLPAEALSVPVPGDPVEQAALGYLHANCGVSCHNASTLAPAKMSGLHLRLEVATAGNVHTTPAVTTGINRVPSANAEVVGLPLDPGQYYDFRPLDVARSLSLARMEYRGSATAMPPLGTHLVDAEGVAILRAWVEQMTPERGYPAASP